MNHYLIDYENVKVDYIKNLPGTREGDEVVIFYSEQCKNIALEAVESLLKRNLKLLCCKVVTGTKNALDFQLASYLGYLLGKDTGNAKYHIVSNDKGFDCLCDYWKNQGKSVDRICASGPVQPVPVQEKVNENIDGNDQQDSESGTKKKKGKVLEHDMATMEEIKSVLSIDDNPEDVLLIFNQYKTKQAICNGLSKKYKDSKKASAIYKKLKPLLKKKHKT